MWMTGVVGTKIPLARLFVMLNADVFSLANLCWPSNPSQRNGRNDAITISRHRVGSSYCAVAWRLRMRKNSAKSVVHQHRTKDLPRATHAVPLRERARHIGDSDHLRDQTDLGCDQGRAAGRGTAIRCRQR